MVAERGAVGQLEFMTPHYNTLPRRRHGPDG
jgi:hypothetical protein